MKDQPFEGNVEEARLDWMQIARDYNRGFQPPCEATLRAIGSAAGGLPEHATAIDCLERTAEVLRSLKTLEK